MDFAPGELVVARYSVDLQWYRARVISSGDRQVEVCVGWGMVGWGEVGHLMDSALFSM